MPADVKSWTTFFTNKIEKTKKNKPYKAFSRYRTDLSLVGLNSLLYMFFLDRLQRGVFHHFLKFLYCHSSIFRCFFNCHTAFSHLFNQHTIAFGIYATSRHKFYIFYSW